MKTLLNATLFLTLTSTSLTVFGQAGMPMPGSMGGKVPGGYGSGRAPSQSQPQAHNPTAKPMGAPSKSNPIPHGGPGNYTGKLPSERGMHKPEIKGIPQQFGQQQPSQYSPSTINSFGPTAVGSNDSTSSNKSSHNGPGLQTTVPNFTSACKDIEGYLKKACKGDTNCEGQGRKLLNDYCNKQNNNSNPNPSLSVAKAKPQKVFSCPAKQEVIDGVSYFKGDIPNASLNYVVAALRGYVKKQNPNCENISIDFVEGQSGLNNTCQDFKAVLTQTLMKQSRNQFLYTILQYHDPNQAPEQVVEIKQLNQFQIQQNSVQVQGVHLRDSNHTINPDALEKGKITDGLADQYLQSNKDKKVDTNKLRRSIASSVYLKKDLRAYSYHSKKYCCVASGEKSRCFSGKYQNTLCQKYNLKPFVIDVNFDYRPFTISYECDEGQKVKSGHYTIHNDVFNSEIIAPLSAEAQKAYVP